MTILAVPGQPRSDTERRVVRTLRRELRPRFGAGHTAAEIALSVRGALRDLRGSVSDEALTEMGYRLASQRLDREPDRVGDEPGPTDLS